MASSWWSHCRLVLHFYVNGILKYKQCLSLECFAQHFACGIHVVMFSHSSFILFAEYCSIALACLNGFPFLAIKQAMTKEDNEA